MVNLTYIFNDSSSENRLYLGISRETSKEAPCRRNPGERWCLDPSCYHGRSEKWLDLGYILKVEVIGFSEGF